MIRFTTLANIAYDQQNNILSLLLKLTEISGRNLIL